MRFEIVTDSSCNLTDEIIDQFGLHILPLTFMSDGEQYQSYVKGQKSDLKAFFKMMRDGKVFTTSLPNRDFTENLLRGLLDGGKDVLYIGFSSGLSGTFETTAALLEELRSLYPQRKIYYADTLAAALGEGLLVYKAALLAEGGASIEEVHAWVEDNKLKVAHWFTVDDLMFLFRGGRVSRTSAWAGSLLNIKPVLHVDDEGHLIPMEKVRGRKKSIQALFNHMKESALEPVSEQTVFISHGDCLEDARLLEGLVREISPDVSVTICQHEPFSGAHVGPGMLALFFHGKER